MTARTVQLLHIEDDVLQQQLTAQQLAGMPGYSFAITWADTEDEAISAFQRSRHELVLLDYHLNQGNGLSCLQKLRQLDTIVPIIALSGQTKPEIAAELLKAGADDYLSKLDLATETLTNCLRDALLRADAWRRQAPPAAEVGALDLARQVFHTFAGSCNPALLAQLDAFEAAARQAHLEVDQLQQCFQAVCAELTAARPGDLTQTQRLLRPLVLEMFLRLWGEQLDAAPGLAPR